MSLRFVIVGVRKKNEALVFKMKLTNCSDTISPVKLGCFIRFKVCDLFALGVPLSADSKFSNGISVVISFRPHPTYTGIDNICELEGRMCVFG